MKTDPIYVERSMTTEPQLFRVNPQSRETNRVEEVEFSALGFQERRDIQEWVAANPGILGENLLIIAKEFSGFDRTNERLDLLAVDEDGKLVVIELKRDDTGADAHWQAIKYASYLHRAKAEVIVEMLARHAEFSEQEAEEQLVKHLGADDLKALNTGQRIILASHRFAPEVTSAVLWLNEKTPGENLITCVKLTPHRDANTNSLYIQASTIIPVPGVDRISVGDTVLKGRAPGGNNFAVNLQKAYDRNKNDGVTHFLRSVGDHVIRDLPNEIRPDKISRWGGGWPHHRYYHFWYRRPPWDNWGLSYRVNLFPQDGEGQWAAEVVLEVCPAGMEGRLAGIRLHEDQEIHSGAVKVRLGTDNLSEDFAKRIGDVARKFIVALTPIVDSLEDEGNEEDT